MEDKKRKKRFIVIWSLSSISFILVILEQTISAYRKELIGFDPRVAGHNFAYNFMIFIPTILVSIVLSVIALIVYLSTWRTIKSSDDRLTWFERLSIVPSFIPLLMSLYVIGIIIYIIIKSNTAA